MESSYLDEPNVGSLLPERLAAHVQSVFADETGLLARAGDDAGGVSGFVQSWLGIVRQGGFRRKTKRTVLWGVVRVSVDGQGEEGKRRGFQAK